MNGSALVVGGSSVVGAAIAQALARLGLDVVLWGRDAERLEANRRLVGDGQARALTVDVTDRAALSAAVAELTAHPPLRVAVWAAGLFDWAPADQADGGSWERLLDVNLTSAALATTLLLPQLVDSAPSTLVYVGSGASRQAYANNAAYVASKQGLLGLSQAVWLDVRDRDVKVSLVSPGLVAAGAGLRAPVAATHPEWLLAPEDVASAVAFVATFSGRGCPTEIRIETQRSV